MTHRQPARAIAVASLGFCLVVAATVACGSGDARAQTTANLRLQSFALQLHPLKMADVESRRVGSLLYSGLVAVDQEGTVHARIAKSWTESRPGEWKFELRDNLSFSNGTPLHAEDVVASLCAALQPQSPWAWALSSIATEAVPDSKQVRCTGIGSAGTGTVTIREVKPVPWLLDALSGPAGWIIPQDPGLERAYGAMPGAGPYAVREIRPDSRVVLAARSGRAAVRPGVDTVVFHYVADPAVAAGMFTRGKLDVLDVDTPLLVDLLLRGEPPDSTMRQSGRVEAARSDRVRVVIVNEKRLLQRGFSAGQVRAFIDRFGASVDRARIANLSKGIAIPMEAPVPIGEVRGTDSNPATSPDLALPNAGLSMITESDPFSDLIAASLPNRVGRVRISYRGVDKGILIDSLLKGDYDLVSLIIEATVHAPKFWTAFFTPGNPFVIFGKPIDGLEKFDLSRPPEVANAAGRISDQGNWIGILREQRVQVFSPRVSGVYLTPSGQPSYEEIRVP